ncbi:MAG: SDR family oxidoreductase [Syntrophomonadaceae bacterium]|nr:SDR family oxidoreductase [Syntrophomonadaceae bacterium]
MARDFKDKLVVITGAASGLGYSLCKRFAKAGARIAGIDKDEIGLAALSEELASMGVQASTFVCDVTDEDLVNITFRQIIDSMGDIYVLINNAGVSHISPFYKTKVSVLKRVIDISLFGTIYCTKAAIDSLIRTKGMVIGISSVAGFAPLAGRTGYAAAKHGMVGFLNTLRTEVARYGVKVLVVFATYIKTNIDKNNLSADGTPMGGGRPTSGNVLMPDDAADSIFVAAAQEERQLMLGDTAQASWDLYHSDPAAYEEIMLSLNEYVFEL